MEWIPIGRQLPEENQIVLAFRPYAHELGDETFTVLRFNNYLSTDHNNRPHGFERSHYVSHWQPLVEPK